MSMKVLTKVLRQGEGKPTRPTDGTLRRDRSFTVASPVAYRTVSRHQQSNFLEAVCKGGNSGVASELSSETEVAMKNEMILGIDMAKRNFEAFLLPGQGRTRQRS